MKNSRYHPMTMFREQFPDCPKKDKDQTILYIHDVMQRNQHIPTLNVHPKVKELAEKLLESGITRKYSQDQVPHLDEVKKEAAV